MTGRLREAVNPTSRVKTIEFSVPRTDDDLADILYTSGTAGRPEAVAVRHSAGGPR